MRTQVAVVILNYNTRHFLEKFLPFVLQTDWPDFRVIVVDNASTDDSLHLLKERFPEVERMAFDQNYGFTGGYNRALQQIDAEYFVLLNSDVEVDANWIKPMMRLFEENPKIAAVQPKLLDWNAREKFEYAGASGGFIDLYGFPFCRGRLFDTLELDSGQYQEAIPVFWASGAALFIKAEVYKQLGGLDEDFFAHMEEIDLCWRIQNAGYEIWVCPESKVYHVGGGTLQKSNPKKTFYNFRNGLILLLKNLPSSKLIPVLLMRLILDHIAAYRFLFQGKSADFKAIAAAHREFIFKFRYWKSKRKEQSVKPAYSGQRVYRYSIVRNYFLGKIKYFSDIQWKK